MKLILVRHGETEKNDEGVLTPKGIGQVKKVGKELKEKYKIDMVFCSPLKRAVETLENILDEYPIEGEIFMSKLIEEMGLEPLTDFVKRVNLFLEDLKLEDENSTILVISHEGPIKIMVAKITGKKYKEMKVPNGSISVFEDFR
jgi:broad specificity phosphatase PhoE